MSKIINNLQIAVLLTISLTFLLSACSFSDSSYSSSSPSRSSSGASAGGEEEVQQTSNKYQEEIATLTAIYVDTQGDARSFHRQISNISNRHGINSWGDNRGTFVAIGRGIQNAKVSQESIQHLSFLDDLRSMPLYGAVLSGYEGE